MGFLLPTALVILLDQFTKHFFWQLGKNFGVIGGLLRVTLVKNSGAAFGLFQGSRLVFIVISLLASIFISYLGLRTPSHELKKRLSLGLILGGALSNLIDRIYAGEVIDFIDMGIGVYRWPVYNLADIAVTVGAVFLFFAYLRSGRKDEG